MPKRQPPESGHLTAHVASVSCTWFKSVADSAHYKGMTLFAANSRISYLSVDSDGTRALRLVKFIIGVVFFVIPHRIMLMENHARGNHR